MTKRTLCAAVVLALAAPALAQFDNRRDEEVEVPPSPPTAREADPVPWALRILVLPVIIGACVGVNCIPSKRGHQD